jgi:type IV pilus assembly protein PilM
MAQKRTAKPRLACEITHQNVIGARASSAQDAVEVYTVRRLPEGALLPAVSEANVADAEALRTAIAGALSPLAGRAREVIAVVPDAAVHVLLLDFDELPERENEAEPLVRFRLKKSLPFDVDQAAISFQRRREGNAVKVLAAVMPGNIRDEYEALFRDAGYLPGVLISSTLATLAALRADAPTLLVKIDGPSITMAIADRGELLLYRTLELPAGRELTAGEIADAVFPSIVFFEDNYSSPLERVVLSGRASPQQVREALENQTTARFEEFAASAAVGESLSGDSTLSRSMLSGVVGALTA